MTRRSLPPAMKVLTALLAACLLSFALPQAAADSCTDSTAIAVAGLYVGGDVSVWQESNNHAGLQRVACEDDNGRIIPADGRVL